MDKDLTDIKRILWTVTQFNKQVGIVKLNKCLK